METTPINFATIWWVVTAALVAAELLTGSIYLLMFALGTAAGALAAHAGLGINAQMAIIILVDVVATTALFWWRKRAPKTQDNANPNLHLDIGAVIQVDDWQTDGTAQVQYRGTQWTAQFAESRNIPQAGLHRIREVAGSRLIVEAHQEPSHG